MISPKEIKLGDYVTLVHDPDKLKFLETEIHYLIDGCVRYLLSIGINSILVCKQKIA